MVSGCEPQELMEIGKNEYVPLKAAHGIKQLRKNFSLEVMRDDDIASQYLTFPVSTAQYLLLYAEIAKIPPNELKNDTWQIWWLTVARRKTAKEQKFPILLLFLYFFPSYMECLNI